MSGATPCSSAAILKLWFEDTRPQQWFNKDPRFDQQLRNQFLDGTRQALGGQLAHWSDAPDSALALVLLLDQFPRQIWRDTPLAFAGDDQALALSQAAEQRGWLEAEVERPRRQFWLMPRMHSEDAAIQDAALPLFARFTDSRTRAMAQRHRDLITRFGRFPHRNAILGRVSSREELAFLQTPGSSF